MPKTDRKMAVLRVLQSAQGSVSLPQLISRLEGEFPQRTVRRWLAEMIKQGKVEKTGQKRGTRYRAINKDIISNAPLRSLTSLSEDSIAYVKKPIFQRRPVSYYSAWLEDYVPNQVHFFTSEQRSHMQTQGWRGDNHEPAGTYARKILNRLLIDLSYNSSRLEGNTYSLLETERLLSHGLSAQGKLDTERVMILNHKEAIRYLVDNSHKLNVEYNEICSLHYLLADGLVPTEYAGNVREQGVRIGQSTYIPMEGKTSLVKQLHLICDKARPIQDPFEQSLFLLIHIAYLQAFIDVNKRVSRLSANIPLIRQNLVPLSFNDVDKDDYISAMIAMYELQDVSPLAELYYFSYIRTCRQYDSTIEAMGFDEIRVRYRQERRTLIQQIIVQKLVNESLIEFAQHYVEQYIPKKDQSAFMKTIDEDLEQLAPQRIAGLGISLSELETWVALKSGSSNE